MVRETGGVTVGVTAGERVCDAVAGRDCVPLAVGFRVDVADREPVTDDVRVAVAAAVGVFDAALECDGEEVAPGLDVLERVTTAVELGVEAVVARGVGAALTVDDIVGDIVPDCAADTVALMLDEAEADPADEPLEVWTIPSEGD